MMFKDDEKSRLAKLLDFIPEEHFNETLSLALNAQDASEFQTLAEGAGVKLDESQAGMVFDLVDGRIELEDEAIDVLAAGKAWYSSGSSDDRS